ncbi:MAG: Hsp20/alpha crystallin family protein [Actinomycetota bacterium]
MATLSRWDPFRDLMGIQNEFNRLFGRTYGGEAGPGDSGAWMPAIDIYEGKDKYVISVELAGVEPADVDISVEDSTLTVRGERKFYREVDEDSFHRVERRYGAFSRSLSLPQTANADAIEASFDRGVLTVEIPKVEEAKPKKITVKAKG